MRQFNFLLISLACLISSNIAADQNEETTRNFSIGVQPAPGILGIADVQFSAKILPHLDVLASIDGGYFWMAKLLSPKEDFWALAGGLGARWWFNTPLKDGFYTQAQVKAGYLQFGHNTGGPVLVPSLGAGYGWYFASDLFTSVGLDVHLLITPNGFDKEKDILPIKFPVPLLNWTIGYTF